MHTPTEMLAAHRAGATLLKLFPAPAGGPAWLRSVLAPLPMLPVVPTGGVELDNLAQWFEAGAVGVGMVGDVFRPQWLAAGDFDAIHARVAAFRATVQACWPYRGGAGLSPAREHDRVGQQLAAQRGQHVAPRQVRPSCGACPRSPSRCCGSTSTCGSVNSRCAGGA
ncbi:MAG: hypothetical protein U0168_25395 [Nannocystaceae bacterium]